MKEIIQNRLDVKIVKLIQHFTHPKQHSSDVKTILQDFEKLKNLVEKSRKQKYISEKHAKWLKSENQKILKDIKKIHKNCVINQITKFKLRMLLYHRLNFNDNRLNKDSKPINYDLSISILLAVWENLNESADHQFTKNITKIIYFHIYSIINIEDIPMLTYIFLDMFTFNCDITIFECLIQMLKYYFQTRNISENNHQNFKLRIEIFNSMVQQINNSDAEARICKNLVDTQIGSKDDKKIQKYNRILIPNKYYCTIISILDLPSALNSQIQYLRSYSNFLPKSIMIYYDEIISCLSKVCDWNGYVSWQRNGILQFIISVYIKCGYVAINNECDHLKIDKIFLKIAKSFSCHASCHIWKFLDAKDKWNMEWISIVKRLYDKYHQNNQISRVSLLTSMIYGSIYIGNLNIAFVTKIFAKCLNFRTLANHQTLLSSLQKMMSVYSNVVIELHRALLQESIISIIEDIEIFSKHFTMLYLGTIKIEIWNVLLAIRWLTEENNILYEFSLSFLKSIILMDSKCSDFHLRLNHAVAYMLKIIISSNTDLSSQRKKKISLLLITTRINLLEYDEIFDLKNTKNYLLHDEDNYKFIMDVDSKNSSVLKNIFTLPLCEMSSELWKICTSDRSKENGSIIFYKSCILILLHECNIVEDYSKTVEKLDTFVTSLIECQRIQEVLICVNKCLSLFGKYHFIRKISNKVMKLISNSLDSILNEIKNAIIHTLEIKNNKKVFTFWLKVILDQSNESSKSKKDLLHFICSKVFAKPKIIDLFLKEISKLNMNMSDKVALKIFRDSSNPNIFLKGNSNSLRYIYIHWLNYCAKNEEIKNFMSQINSEILHNIEIVPETNIEMTNLYQRLNLILNDELFPLNIYLFLHFWVNIKNNKEYLDMIMNSEQFLLKMVQVETHILNKILISSCPKFKNLSPDHIEFLSQFLFCLKNKKYSFIDSNLFKNNVDMSISNHNYLTYLMDENKDNWFVRRIPEETNLEIKFELHTENPNILEYIYETSHIEIIKILDLPDFGELCPQSDQEASAIDAFKNLKSSYLNIIPNLDSHENLYNTLSAYMNNLCSRSYDETKMLDEKCEEHSQTKISKNLYNIDENKACWAKIIENITDEKIVDMTPINILILTEDFDLALTNELEIQLSVFIESIKTVMKQRKSYSLTSSLVLSVYFLKIIFKYCKRRNYRKIYIIFHNQFVDESILFYKTRSILDFEFLPELYFILQKICIGFVNDCNHKYVKKVINILCKKECNWQPVIQILCESNCNSIIEIFLKNLYIIIKFIHKWRMKTYLKIFMKSSLTLLAYFISKNSDSARQTECMKLIFSQIFYDLNDLDCVCAILSEFQSSYIQIDSNESCRNIMHDENIEFQESLKESIIVFSLEHFIILLQQIFVQKDLSNLFLISHNVLEIYLYIIKIENERESQQYSKLINICIRLIHNVEKNRSYDSDRKLIFMNTFEKVMNSMGQRKELMINLLLNLPLNYQIYSSVRQSIQKYIHENFKMDQDFVDLMIQDNLSLKQAVNCAFVIANISYENIVDDISDFEYAILRIFTHLATNINHENLSLEICSNLFNKSLDIILDKSQRIPINGNQMLAICQILNESLWTQFVYIDGKSSNSKIFSNLIYLIRKGSKMNILCDRFKHIDVNRIISNDTVTIFYSSLIKILFKSTQDGTYSSNQDKLLQTLIMDMVYQSDIYSSENSNVISNISQNIQDDNIVCLFWERMIVEFEDISFEDQTLIQFISCTLKHVTPYNENYNFYRLTCITLARYINISFKTKLFWILRILDVCVIIMEIYDSKTKLNQDPDSNDNNAFDSITQYIQSKFGEISHNYVNEFLNYHKYDFYLTRLCILAIHKLEDESISRLFVKMLQNLESYITHHLLKTSIVQQWSIYMLISTFIDLMCKNYSMDTSLINSTIKFVSCFLNIGHNLRFTSITTVDDGCLSIKHVKKFQQFIFLSSCLLCSIHDQIVVPKIRDEKYIYEYFLDDELLHRLNLENLHENLVSNKTATNYWTKAEIIAHNDKLRKEWQKIYI